MMTILVMITIVKGQNDDDEIGNDDSELPCIQVELTIAY